MSQLEPKLGDWIARESYLSGCPVPRAECVVAIGKRIKVMRYPGEPGETYHLIAPADVWAIFESQEQGDELCQKAKDFWWEQNQKVKAAEAERDKEARLVLQGKAVDV